MKVLTTNKVTTFVRTYSIFLSITMLSVAFSCFANFTGKQLSRCLFLKWLRHRCFPVKFAKFLQQPFLQNTPGGCFWVLIDFISSTRLSDSSWKIKSSNYRGVESDADSRQYTGTWEKYPLPKPESRRKPSRMSLNAYFWTFLQNLKNIYLPNFNESNLRSWLDILNKFCHW